MILFLSSVAQLSHAQLVGDIDKDALKAQVEQQLDEQEEKDSELHNNNDDLDRIGNKDSVAENDIVLDVGVLCNSEDITLTLTVTTDTFNGMIYPKGLSKNSTCMTEYIQQEVSVTSHTMEHMQHHSQHVPEDNECLVVAGDSEVHAAAEVMQHHVHGRVGWRGVLQHGGGAAPQEAGHQPGSRLPCEM